MNFKVKRVINTKIFILILISIFNQITNISIYMEGDRDFCFYKYFENENSLNLSYLISGEDQTNTRVSIVDPNNEEIYSNTKEEGTFNHKTTQVGDYRLCFFPDTRADNSVSFEFAGESDLAHLFKVAKGEEITDMKKDILSVQAVFEQIEMNIKYIIERQKAHTESKLK